MTGGYVDQTAVGFSRLPAIMMVEAPAIAVASSPPQVVDVVPPLAYRGRIGHRYPQMMQESGTCRFFRPSRRAARCSTLPHRGREGHRDRPGHAEPVVSGGLGQLLHCRYPPRIPLRNRLDRSHRDGLELWLFGHFGREGRDPLLGLASEVSRAFAMSSFNALVSIVPPVKSCSHSKSGTAKVNESLKTRPDLPCASSHQAGPAGEAGGRVRYQEV
jgi:hypothetical protein